MQEIKFNNNINQQVYLEYLEKCKKALSILSKEDQNDSLMEINSFIFEHLEANKNIDEGVALSTILDRLGDPEALLNDVVAVKKIDEVVKTYNVKSFFQAIYLNLRKGTLYVFIGLLSLLLLCFPVIIIFELLDPNNTGLYIGKNSFFFGIRNPESDEVELLGSFLIPTCILICLLLYFTIIYLLKSISKHRNSNLTLSQNI